MNAKQRKAASKMRERAMLDADAKLTKIETEQRNMAAAMIALKEARKGLATEHEDFQVERATWNVEKAAWKEEKEKRIKDYIERQMAEMASMREKFANYEDGKILREVLLQLEMDIPPEEIAANLRRENQLLVPTW